MYKCYSKKLTFDYIVDCSTTAYLQQKNIISSYIYPFVNIASDWKFIIIWCEMENDQFILSSCSICVQRDSVKPVKCFFILIF